MSERIALVLRSDYFTSVLNKDIAFFDTRRTGDLRKYHYNYLF
jgi:ABC-type bacteriocin/lantibiotic exporter with double-glycine peptidase domain